MLGLRKESRDRCTKLLPFKIALQKLLNSSTMKAWIHLLSSENSRSEVVEVTLLPLFNGEDNMVKEMSKNITEISRKGSSAPGFKQGVAPGIRQKRKARGGQKFVDERGYGHRKPCSGRQDFVSNPSQRIACCHQRNY